MGNSFLRIMQNAGAGRTSIIRKWTGGSIMYKTYWGMEFNPFDKEIKETQYYQGED